MFIQLYDENVSIANSPDLRLLYFRQNADTFLKIFDSDFREISAAQFHTATIEGVSVPCE